MLRSVLRLSLATSLVRVIPSEGETGMLSLYSGRPMGTILEEIHRIKINTGFSPTVNPPPRCLHYRKLISSPQRGTTRLFEEAGGRAPIQRREPGG